MREGCAGSRCSRAHGDRTGIGLLGRGGGSLAISDANIIVHFYGGEPYIGQELVATIKGDADTVCCRFTPTSDGRKSAFKGFC